MNNNSQKLYTEYKQLLQKAADFNYAYAVLSWDLEVYMPPMGASQRGRQLSTLATEAHQLLTGKTIELLLLQLANSKDLTNIEQHNIRLSTLDFEKNRKLSTTFVENLSHQSTTCFNAWIAARKENNFTIFQASLEKMIALKRKQAELYGYEKHPYDALLNDFERGATVEMLDPIFKGIKESFPTLLQQWQTTTTKENNCLHQFFPKQQQWDFSLKVLHSIGFNFEAGKQDYSEHPFTTSFGSQDVRITTRVNEHNLADLLWSSIHEGGHGLYEQGLPEHQYGLPLGEAASLSIHESQSRFWENCIGRSWEFWEFFFSQLQNYFPNQLKDISLQQFYNTINLVTPSLIRTEADELTYHFHILIRYEIEKALIDGSLVCKDLVAVWEELYQKYLGIKPKDDNTGILQDVHWSHGSFGYFPTYTLGSFYAAQFFAQAKKELEVEWHKIAEGDMRFLLIWLRKHIHHFGRQFTSQELCEKICGKSLDTQVFITYLKNKFAKVS